MSLLPVGISGEEVGYQIERSLRFNSADSAYLNRTPATASNRTTWTWSGWVKRGGITLASNTPFFSAGTSSSEFVMFYVSSTTDRLTFYTLSGGVDYGFQTSAVLRDPSAWYHLMCVYDSTNGTAANRLKLYINGVQYTDKATDYGDIPLNHQTFVNATNEHLIGKYTGNTQYLNGYMTEINFIDGSALTPSSFGETDTDTGVWKPKKYTGSYGAQGFYLKFADNSGTTSTTLGKDSSGNGNNWTPNNFSVTAGAGNDSLVDTPTPYGTDTGVGGEVRGNYATMNPLDKAGSGSTTFSNGNLTIAVGDNANPRGTFYVNSGKWYWEGTITAGANVATIGIAEGGFYSGNLFDTASTAKAYIYINDGTKRSSLAGTATAYGNSYTTNDVIGVALDMDAGTVKFYKNGVVQNSGTAAYTGLTGNHAPYFQGYGGTATWDVNFGQRPFAYTAPSGFKALVTTNLPEPTIADGGEYFNTVTYTGTLTDGQGTGATQSITGVGFQPDFLWLKNRTNANQHLLVDAVRTVTNYRYLNSASTGAETTVNSNGAISALNADGFTVENGNDSSAKANLVGASGWNYVAWNWKANGAGSTNTAGTITSTVSVNTTSGFSIVTYTGTGANATVGHGLGVTPSMVIAKKRDGTADSWQVYHANMNASPATGTLFLNTTDGFTTSAVSWNNTAPTSTVVSIGTVGRVNNNGSAYVMYAFAPVAGYSAFGRYTGNGNADGPFVFTGFRPALILTKPSSASGNWTIFDTRRSDFNVADDALFPNQSLQEFSGSAYSVDILSNGFKMRNTDTDRNSNGVTYIYMAFAENPFKYSLAR